MVVIILHDFAGAIRQVWSNVLFAISFTELVFLYSVAAALALLVIFFLVFYGAAYAILSLMDIAFTKMRKTAEARFNKLFNSNRSKT